MLNRSGVSKSTFGAPTQILANVEMQVSVGCIVDDAIVSDADANGKKIVKAGTPIVIDFKNLQTPAVAPSGDMAANAVLLHDVDVTKADANGTALIFGFVNLNRLDSATAALIEDDVIGGVTFIKA